MADQQQQTPAPQGQQPPQAPGGAQGAPPTGGDPNQQNQQQPPQPGAQGQQPPGGQPPWGQWPGAAPGGPYGQYPPQPYYNPYGGPPPQQQQYYNYPPPQFQQPAGTPDPSQQQSQPPQGQWPQQPPQGQWPQQPPQGQWPQQPPQGQWPQQPPQGQWPQQPQGQWPQGPGGQYQPPPPQAFAGYPPQGPGQGQQWGQPPQQQGWPQQPVGTAPTQGYGQPTGAPTPASLGFDLTKTAPSTYDAGFDAQVLSKALNRFNVDEKSIINTLVKLGPLEIEALNKKYVSDTKKVLSSVIEDKTRGSLEDGLMALARGPLQGYVWLVNRSVEGMGTNEKLLDLSLLGRSNADINAIKTAYKAAYGRTLESIVRDDLSNGEKTLFNMVMAAARTEDSAGVNPAHVTAEVKAFHGATKGRIGADSSEVAKVLVKNNDATLAAIFTEYEKTYHQSVEQVIKDEYSGHMEQALLFILRGVKDKAKRDADLIENCLSGMIVSNEELAHRIIAAHWIPGAIPAIKVAYKKAYGRELLERVKDKTSGDFERLLVAILNKT